MDIKKGISFERERIIYLLMLAVAFFLNIKYIFVDFGIDSEFQITMSYRLVKGDIMFKEMWEPYQMSAFLCAFFIKLFVDIFHTTTGIVLYLQIVGVLLNGAVAFFLYTIVKKYIENRKVAFAMAWVFLVVSPKDVPLPEYANMQMWFSMLLCIMLFLHYKTRKARFVILAAICLCGVVLSYPSCLIVFVGVMCLLLYYGEKKDAYIFGVTCFLVGALYLIFIFQNISFSDFCISIQNMLNIETSHAMGFVEKSFNYLKSFAKIVIVMGISYGISFGLTRAIRKIKNDGNNKDFYKVLTDILFFGMILFISLYTVIFFQKFVRYCYSFIFIGIIFIGTHYVKKLSTDKYYLYLCGTVISLLQFVATLILTNLQLMASVPYLLIALIVAFLPISEALKLAEMEGMKKKLKVGVMFCFASFLVFRNAYIIRPMSLYVSTIGDIGGIVKEGPAIGIISEYMGPYIQNESMKEWKQYIQDGDIIYLVGGELGTMGYMYADTIFGGPSLVPTPGYNESIAKYWEINPHKYPDVIIAVCWYGDLNRSYGEDSWIIKWIEEEYKPEHYVDGKYWRYYFKEAR